MNKTLLSLLRQSLALVTRGPELLKPLGKASEDDPSVVAKKMSSHVTISAKRLTETRGGGTRTVNMIRDLDLHVPSSFSLQGSQFQGGGTVL